MIKYRIGDIILISGEVEAMVNTVNCVGVMGRGIALQFKRKFPKNFKAYEALCKRNEIQPGHMFVFETEGMFFPRYIINFPTKRHWRSKSRIEDIESGLDSLVREIRSLGIRSIAVPPLGCGLGGLDWAQVRACIQATLGSLQDVRIVVFEPGGGPADNRPNHSIKVPNMTPGRAVVVGLMDRYLRGSLDPFVTLLEVHKLTYFMQAAGEPLRLQFEKGQYGPYATNLRHVLKTIEGHLVSGYSDGGDEPRKELKLVPGALNDAQKFLQSKPEIHARFERVSDLVEGFEEPFGLELLSTVHWIANQEGLHALDDIITSTYAWAKGKKQFTEYQIKVAYDILLEKGWIECPNAQEIVRG